MRRFLFLVLILDCYPAYAELVKVVAVGDDIYYADPLGLLPFPAPPLGSAMTFSFIYDSDTPDLDPDPDGGLYPGAVSELTLAVSGTTLSAFPDDVIRIVNDGVNDGDGDGVPDSIVVDVWIAQTSVTEAGGRTSIMSLAMFRLGGGAIDSDALVALDGNPSPWILASIDYLVADGPDPDLSVTLASAGTHVDSIEVATVPAPASGLPLISGLLAAASWLRSRNRAK